VQRPRCIPARFAAATLRAMGMAWKVAAWGPLLALLLGGCDAGDRREHLHERLLDLRAERTELLDALYDEYGGSDVARAIDEGLGQEEGGPEAPAEGEPGRGAEEGGEGVLEMMRGLVRESDRSVFEEHCRVAGRGDRVTALTQRARDFFARPEVRERCREVVELDFEIDATERELAALEPEPERETAPEAQTY